MKRNEFIFVAKEEDIEAMGIVKHRHLEYIYDILILMKKANEFPLGNTIRLQKIVLEYWRKYDFTNAIREQGLKWNLLKHPNYVKDNSVELQTICAEHGTPFGYYRPYKDGTFKGMWIFINKKQFIEITNDFIAGMNKQLNTAEQRIELLNGKGFNIPKLETSKIALIGETEYNKPKLITRRKA
jgi:hypothetical protein